MMDDIFSNIAEYEELKEHLSIIKIDLNVK